MGKVESDIHDAHHNSPTRPACIAHESVVQSIRMCDEARGIHIGYARFACLDALHLRVARQFCQTIGSQGYDIEVAPMGLNLASVLLQGLFGRSFDDGTHTGCLAAKGRRFASLGLLLDNRPADIGRHLAEVGMLGHTGQGKEGCHHDGCAFLGKEQTA